MFRRVRACENLLLNGYPLDGYALLRDLKDRAIFLAAIVHNWTTWETLFGYGPGVPVPTSYDQQLTETDQRLMRRNAEKEERRLLGLMLRKESGLDQNVLRAIQKWERLFNQEIHGAKLSFFTELGDWAVRKSELSIGPVPKDKHMGMYMNRICEIGWLVTRLLPYLQPVPHAFGEEWQMKWGILDDSFLYMQQGLSRIGKDIGDAFITFVNKKFDFKDTLSYSEPDATGS
jgi:hypothetical protein